MPKVVEIYKEVKQLVKVKSFTGVDAELNAAKYIDCSTELIRHGLTSGKRIHGGHYIKKKIVSSTPQHKKVYEKGLIAKAKKYLTKNSAELDMIKGRVIEEYGIDHELFDKRTHARIPVIARQAFCYLVYTRIKSDVGATFACAIIAEYLGMNRTTITYSIDAVLDGLEMPFSDYQWIKKVKI